MFTFGKILILAVVQGAAELLPVSSSAHVIVAAKLMGLDPTTPEMTLLLVMLHTGTMFAVIWYFRTLWREEFFSSGPAFRRALSLLFIATLCTGLVGLALKWGIEKTFLSRTGPAEIELLFGNLLLISGALATVGLLIVWAGIKGQAVRKELSMRDSVMIGLIQGICLPFRGFSRSGATISTGLLLGLEKVSLESFSFALAVVLTPPVIVREVLRLLKAQVAGTSHLASLFYPGLLGMVLSFVSGLAALRWLSRWLEEGRWQLFGYYCLLASLAVFALYWLGA